MVPMEYQRSGGLCGSGLASHFFLPTSVESSKWATVIRKINFLSTQNTPNIFGEDFLLGLGATCITKYQNHAMEMSLGCIFFLCFLVPSHNLIFFIPPNSIQRLSTQTPEWTRWLPWRPSDHRANGPVDCPTSRLEAWILLLRATTPHWKHRGTKKTNLEHSKGGVKNV